MHVPLLLEMVNNAHGCSSSHMYECKVNLEAWKHSITHDPLHSAFLDASNSPAHAPRLVTPPPVYLQLPTKALHPPVLNPN